MFTYDLLYLNRKHLLSSSASSMLFMKAYVPLCWSDIDCAALYCSPARPYCSQLLINHKMFFVHIVLKMVDNKVV